MKLNRLLVSTNRHQQCIVDHQREDIDRLRSQLVKVRAAQQSHPESNEQMVEQLKEIRSLRLSLQNVNIINLSVHFPDPSLSVSVRISLWRGILSRHTSIRFNRVYIQSNKNSLN